MKTRLFVAVSVAVAVAVADNISKLLGYGYGYADDPRKNRSFHAGTELEASASISHFLGIVVRFRWFVRDLANHNG